MLRYDKIEPQMRLSFMRMLRVFEIRVPRQPRGSSLRLSFMRMLRVLKIRVPRLTAVVFHENVACL